MANPIGDPEAVEQLAALYQREAKRIDEVSAAAVSALADLEWVGRRATATRERVRTRHSEIVAQVAELRSLARALEGHARWMRATIRELRELEQRIRHWASTHPPTPERVGPDSSLVGVYPPDCSLEWRQVAARLRAAGAMF